MLTQDINASKNSRLYIEEAYSSLINNTYPNAVDSRMLSQLTGLLDTMEGYQMVAVKRDRLEYIYEQNQAQAIRAAVPSPLGLISAVRSYRPSKIAVSLAYMAIDSITSYTTYTSEKELQYLKDGWARDEQYWFLHDSKLNTETRTANSAERRSYCPPRAAQTLPISPCPYRKRMPKNRSF